MCERRCKKNVINIFLYFPHTRARPFTRDALRNYVLTPFMQRFPSLVNFNFNLTGRAFPLLRPALERDAERAGEEDEEDQLR